MSSHPDIRPTKSIDVDLDSLVVPTEPYVKLKFDKGLAFEVWLEGILRQVCKVVKRRDVASAPHKHEDIKDVPPDADIALWTNSRWHAVWVTHKQMPASKWKKRRTEFIKDMYWRYKTVRSMTDSEYLAYGIFDDKSNVGQDSPLEVLWVRRDNAPNTKLWRDTRHPDQDDWRMGVNMSEAIVIFTIEEGLKVGDIAEIL